MGRGEKAVFKRSFKQRGRYTDNGSDDSDEDYVVESEEIVSEDDSEDLGISLERSASEESFNGFVEHEEFRTVDIPKKKRCSLGDRKTRGKVSQKRKRVSYDEEDGDDDDEDYVNDEDEDEDEEFAPAEDDCLDEDDCFGEDEDEDDDDDDDEDEKVTVRKKNKKVLVKGRRKGRGSKRYQKRSGSRVLKNHSTKKARTKRRLMKKEKLLDEDEDCCDFVDSSPVVKQKSKKHSSVRRKKSAICSDSDFVPSASSDCDYTISEEEKEQVKEASELCGGLKSTLRGSSSVKNIHGDEDLLQQTKSLGRKGKEKVKEVQSEVGKQVCGICLSEEDKRRLRGTLDCCSHYFCFTCIMEWSKVESRCPLCKQRFMTITKNGRSTVGLDQRSLVFEVPKRDQVYQMSEEEIRSFIDPYENVLCTECHEGGDDGLMLLCDLCDSPAHTFCVGLGRQVPEGNWYCNGCIPVALGSSSTLAQDPSLDQRSTTNVFIRPQPIGNSDSLDPISESSPRMTFSSPRMTFSQGFENLSSPRFSNGDVQGASPVSGAGAPTLSMRRQLHRHIQNLFSSSRQPVGRVDAFPAANVCNDSQTVLGGEFFIQNPRIQEMGTSQSTFLNERIQATDHPSSSIQNRNPISLRPSQSSRQVLQGSTFRTADQAGNPTLLPEFNGNNTLAGFQQLHQHSSGSNLGSDGNLSPYRVREEGHFYAVKEQLQSMVKNLLQSSSYDVELDPDTFKDIARSSTHTILAACGFEHKRSEVQVVHHVSVCPHLDRVAAGQTSMMKGYCVSCFDSFVRDVVKTIKDTRMSQWLSLGL